MDKFNLVIGNKNYSSWSLRPWLLMTQFKIPFKEVLIPLYEGDYKKKILAYSPSGKVPYLRHGKVSIWDSLAIAEYLAETFPKKNLWPKDKKARAWARSVSAEMHSGFMSLRKNCPMDVRASRPQEEFSLEVKADIDRIVKIWEGCRKQFSSSGPFLFGKFSIADAMFAPVVWRFETYGVELKGMALQYYQQILALPAMQSWKEAALAEPWVITR